MQAFNNNNRIRPKLLASLMAMVVALNSLAVVSPASAKNPEIDKVKDRGHRSVTLRIDDNRFKNDKVRIKVTVTNRFTGKQVKEESFTKRLDKDGQATVRIGGLMPNTQYRFKVRVRETNDKNYRGSDSKTVKTRSN